MAAKIGRKPYLNIEIVLIVLVRLFGKRAKCLLGMGRSGS